MVWSGWEIGKPKNAKINCSRWKEQRIEEDRERDGNTRWKHNCKYNGNINRQAMATNRREWRLYWKPRS
jgi:hypothetical protein